ncbi:hypothetical protein L873DRAFT_1718632 [Choiromyces venosus 120613-1]|uniref:NTF2-like protein n=1 Tax=Choiromyces venosus 120613-1 TaxID=1336337 RepID=A0A3N4J8U7_9PEZI|nr:hypothetical protein L873DRAFT_1718632 [Choiromyces venosus 120613-1]
MDAPPPTLIIATDTAYFSTAPWIAEGYNVLHLPFANVRKIENATDDIEPNNKCALLAFGQSAFYALSLATSSLPSLTVVIAYYPPMLPSAPRGFHPGIKVLIHLPASAPFSVSGRGVKVSVYDGAEAGFAEEEGEGSYDKVSAGLAYSRTLALLRETVGPEVDLEGIWSEHMLYEFVEKDVERTMSTMVAEPYVNHIPTCSTGGIGYKNLYNFYKHHFIPLNPPSLTMKLISRTVGADRIVDEMVLKFRHDTRIDWMLPGIAPTYRLVEVALVSIVCIRGGKLYHEHIYWDQASVLAQVGLLDIKELPIVGAEGARKVIDEGSVESNVLIPEWNEGR